MQVPLGLENPRRIAHHAQLRAFLVACTRSTPSRVGDAEDKISSIKVLDDTTFNGGQRVELHVETYSSTAHSAVLLQL